MSRFHAFYGGPLSQWRQCSFRASVSGHVRPFTSAEHYMMARKAALFGDQDTLEKIMRVAKPREAKALGRKVRGFNQATWNHEARAIVYDGNMAKFGQNPRLLQLLADTNEKILVEASPVDRIWGIGLAANSPDLEHPERWPGTNWLGQVLEMVRADLLGMSSQLKR